MVALYVASRGHFRVCVCSKSNAALARRGRLFDVDCRFVVVGRENVIMIQISKPGRAWHESYTILDKPGNARKQRSAKGVARSQKSDSDLDKDEGQVSDGEEEEETEVALFSVFFSGDAVLVMLRCSVCAHGRHVSAAAH